MARLFFNDEAESFAHKAWRTLQLQPPVDLHKVADRLGIEVCEREFSKEIDGLYLRLPDVPPIVAINNSYIKPPTRRRFTLAHEIGHHLLGAHIQPGRRLFFLDTAKMKTSPMERACDRFAALLLMPRDLVLLYYEELAFNPQNRVNIMAKRFEVSAVALKRRLRELDLPTYIYK